MYTEGKSVFQMHLIFLLTQGGGSLPKKSLHYFSKQPIKAVIRPFPLHYSFPPPLYSSSVLSLSLCLLKGLST